MNGGPTAASAGKIDVGGDLRRAAAPDVNFIDTADSYGPEVSERLIAEALYPYPEDLVIAAKGGLVRPGPEQWIPDGRPQHLHGACERRLRLDRIDLYQFHRPDPSVPIAESIGTLGELKDEGLCDQKLLVFIPWAPIEQTGTLPALMAAARRRGVTERQVALAVLSR
jgi:pyridoxine 4-dehydrogenase